jgi:hypothetical protein
MQDPIDSTRPRSTRGALVAAVAFAALFAAVPAAQAADQQTTDDELDYVQSWQAAHTDAVQPYAEVLGVYAQAPYVVAQGPHVTHHRHHRTRTQVAQ